MPGRRPVPIAVLDEPPPEDLPGVHAIQIDNRAGRTLREFQRLVDGAADNIEHLFDPFTWLPL